MEIYLTDIPETLLLPLHARAQQSISGNPILVDPLAVQVLEKLQYDFSGIKKAFNSNHNLIWVARARQFDILITEFVRQHPYGTVVNLGAGLDTTFPRVDNGTLRWFDLDLPEVIELRKILIPETSRSCCIARSLFDYAWIDDIGVASDGLGPEDLLLVAAGVFFYFDELELKTFFAELHRRIPGAHIVFDAMSEPAVKRTNELLQTAQMKRAVIKWPLKDARVLESWGCGVHVVAQIPYFFRIPREGCRFTARLMMTINDAFMLTSLVHCTV